LHGRDIEASSSYVCGYEDGAGRGRRGESFNGAEAGFLRHLRMKSLGGDVQVLEEGHEAANGGNRVGEDQGSGVRMVEKERVEV